MNAAHSAGSTPAGEGGHSSVGPYRDPLAITQSEATEENSISRSHSPASDHAGFLDLEGDRDGNSRGASCGNYGSLPVRSQRGQSKESFLSHGKESFYSHGELFGLADRDDNSWGEARESREQRKQEPEGHNPILDEAEQDQHQDQEGSRSHDDEADQEFDRQSGAGGGNLDLEGLGSYQQSRLGGTGSPVASYSATVNAEKTDDMHHLVDGQKLRASDGYQPRMSPTASIEMSMMSQPISIYGGSVGIAASIGVGDGGFTSPRGSSSPNSDGRADPAGDLNSFASRICATQSQSNHLSLVQNHGGGLRQSELSEGIGGSPSFSPGVSRVNSTNSAAQSVASPQDSHQLSPSQIQRSIELQASIELEQRKLLRGSAGSPAAVDSQTMGISPRGSAASGRVLGVTNVESAQQGGALGHQQLSRANVASIRTSNKSTLSHQGSVFSGDSSVELYPRAVRGNTDNMEKNLNRWDSLNWQQSSDHGQQQQSHSQQSTGFSFLRASQESSLSALFDPNRGRDRAATSPSASQTLEQSHGYHPGKNSRKKSLFSSFRSRSSDSCFDSASASQQTTSEWRGVNLRNSRESGARKQSCGENTSEDPGTGLNWPASGTGSVESGFLMSPTISLNSLMTGKRGGVGVRSAELCSVEEEGAEGGGNGTPVLSSGGGKRIPSAQSVKLKHTDGGGGGKGKGDTSCADNHSGSPSSDFSVPVGSKNGLNTAAEGTTSISDAEPAAQQKKTKGGFFGFLRKGSASSSKEKDQQEHESPGDSTRRSSTRLLSDAFRSPNSPANTLLQDGSSVEVDAKKPFPASSPKTSSSGPGTASSVKNTNTKGQKSPSCFAGIAGTKTLSTAGAPAGSTKALDGPGPPAKALSDAQTSSSKTPRTLQQVKSELLDASAAFQQATRKSASSRRGSVVDLGASVAATGICLRDGLDENPAFECFSGVLRPKRSRAAVLMRQQQAKHLYDEYGRRRSSAVLPGASGGDRGEESAGAFSVSAIARRLSGGGAQRGAAGEQGEQVGADSNSAAHRLSTMSVRSDAVLPGGVSQQDLQLLDKFSRSRGRYWWIPQKVRDQFPLPYNGRTWKLLELTLGGIALWTWLWTPFYFAGFASLLDAPSDAAATSYDANASFESSAAGGSSSSPSRPVRDVFVVFDLFAHLLYFLIAVVLRFFTTMPDFDLGIELFEFHDVKERLLHRRPGYLYFDVLTVIPWLYIVGPSSPASHADPSSYLAFLHLIRGVRHLTAIPAAWQEHLMCRVHTSFLYSIEIGRVILWFFLLSHFLGCLWWHTQRCFGQPSTILLHIDGVQAPTLWTFYLNAFRDGSYMLMARDRTAYTNEEIALLGLCAPTSAFFIIWMTGHFAVLLSRIGSMRSQRHEQLQLIRSAMDRHALPFELQHRVLQFHLYSYMNHDSHTYERLLANNSLSTNLKVEIKLWIFRGLIRHVPFFQDASPKAIKALVMNLTIMNFSPGDVVIRCGDTSSEMYFILKGGCQVLRARDLSVIKTLREHDYFGEFALLYKTPRRRTAWVRAQVYCTLAILSAAAFNTILAEFPEQRELMREKIKKVLSSADNNAPIKRKSLEAFDNVFTGADTLNKVGATSTSGTSTSRRRSSGGGPGRSNKLVHKADKSRSGEQGSPSKSATNKAEKSKAAGPPGGGTGRIREANSQSAGDLQPQAQPTVGENNTSRRSPMNVLKDMLSLSRSRSPDNSARSPVDHMSTSPPMSLSSKEACATAIREGGGVEGGVPAATVGVEGALRVPGGGVADVARSVYGSAAVGSSSGGANHTSGSCAAAVAAAADADRMQGQPPTLDAITGVVPVADEGTAGMLVPAGRCVPTAAEDAGNNISRAQGKSTRPAPASGVMIDSEAANNEASSFSEAKELLKSAPVSVSGVEHTANEVDWEVTVTTEAAFAQQLQDLRTSGALPLSPGTETTTGVPFQAQTVIAHHRNTFVSSPEDAVINGLHPNAPTRTSGDGEQSSSSATTSKEKSSDSNANVQRGAGAGPRAGASGPLLAGSVSTASGSKTKPGAGSTSSFLQTLMRPLSTPSKERRGILGGKSASGDDEEDEECDASGGDAAAIRDEDPTGLLVDGEDAADLGGRANHLFAVSRRSSGVFTNDSRDEEEGGLATRKEADAGALSRILAELNSLQCQMQRFESATSSQMRDVQAAVERQVESAVETAVERRWRLRKEVPPDQASTQRHSKADSDNTVRLFGLNLGLAAAGTGVDRDRSEETPPRPLVEEEK
eukprot:g298.t1